MVPELPEVEHVTRGIRPFVKGQKLRILCSLIK